jgi:hypothetical protein
MFESFDFGEFWSQQSAQARLCIATSTGLLLTSGLGVAVNLFAPKLVPLELLSCAGIFYAFIALTNISWRREPQSQVLRSARWRPQELPSATQRGTRPQRDSR